MSSVTIQNGGEPVGRSVPRISPTTAANAPTAGFSIQCRDSVSPIDYMTGSDSTLPTHQVIDCYTGRRAGMGFVSYPPELGEHGPSPSWPGVHLKGWKTGDGPPRVALTKLVLFLRRQRDQQGVRMEAERQEAERQRAERQDAKDREVVGPREGRGTVSLGVGAPGWSVT